MNALERQWLKDNKIKMPNLSGIHKITNGPNYFVSVRKDNKVVYVGSFPTIAAAVRGRNAFNRQGILPPRIRGRR